MESGALNEARDTHHEFKLLISWQAVDKVPGGPLRKVLALLIGHEGLRVRPVLFIEDGLRLSLEVDSEPARSDDYTLDLVLLGCPQHSKSAFDSWLNQIVLVLWLLEGNG